MLSTYCSQYTNVVLCGDINVNMLKNNSISDIVDVHGMKNIVTKPTCFKSETPTLIDVVFILLFLNDLNMFAALKVI